MPGVWQRLASDLKIAVLVFTRLPLAATVPVKSGDVASASWAYPVAGALVGACGAFVYWFASLLGLDPPPAAALALAATIAVTGCLHEDGLADTADGFGGSTDRVRKLEIMHDSRLGTYGVCALAMSLILRWSALAAIARPGAAAAALVAAHAAARAALPAFMQYVPPARADGLASQAGQPSQHGAAVAGLVGVAALAIALGPLAGAICLALLALSCWLLARLTLRQIGGQTGDVMGALEQVNEAVVLMTAAALGHQP